MWLILRTAFKCKPQLLLPDTCSHVHLHASVQDFSPLSRKIISLISDLTNRINLRPSRQADKQTCQRKCDSWQIKWDEIPMSQRTVAIHSRYLKIIDQWSTRIIGLWQDPWPGLQCSLRSHCVWLTTVPKHTLHFSNCHYCRSVLSTNWCTIELL